MPGLDGGADAASVPFSDEAPTDTRDVSHTRHGGLLFLLPILRLLDLPARMAAAPVLAEAPLRLGLHRLGLALAGCAVDDPALAAFCGLSTLPDPSCAGPECPELAAAVVGWADEVRHALARRLAGDAERCASRGGSGLPPRQSRDAASAKLAWLIERDARVVAAPGWIELVFSLDDVDLDLRRAGLDLDPNWVPWLGVVIRYRYE